LDFLKRRTTGAKRVVAVDVHTGLGSYGQDILLVDAHHYDKMRQMFGNRVSPLDPARGTAYRVRGGLQSMVFGVHPGAEVSFVGQEFGTYHALRVVHALREENRWHHYGAGTLDHPVKRRLTQTFCPEDESWRRNLLSRGREVLDRACQIVFTDDRSI